MKVRLLDDFTMIDSVFKIGAICDADYDVFPKNSKTLDVYIGDSHLYVYSRVLEYMAASEEELEMVLLRERLEMSEFLNDKTVVVLYSTKGKFEDWECYSSVNFVDYRNTRKNLPTFTHEKVMLEFIHEYCREENKTLFVCENIGKNMYNVYIHHPDGAVEEKRMSTDILKLQIQFFLLMDKNTPGLSF